MILYPAIDLLDGKSVRLTEGNYDDRTTYGDDPLDVAKSFADQGATHLHVVDLDGAKLGVPVNLKTVDRIIRDTSLLVQTGGGIRTLQTAQQWLDVGARWVVMGTTLVKNRDGNRELFEALGDNLVAGIDTKNGNVAVGGWLEESPLTGADFALELASVGCKTIVFTDIAKDGRLGGPNIEATQALVKAVPGVRVIASGGVSCLADLTQLATTRCHGVIIGKALHEGRFTFAEARADLTIS